jgi:hypothetical protein
VAHLAGELLHAAAQTVPVVPHFYQAVADRFLQADVQLHEGLHAAEIQAAFGRHGIHLAAPKKSLAVPVVSAKASVTRGAAEAPLYAALGLEPATATALDYTSLKTRMHGDMAHVASYRSEDVSQVHPALGGVHVLAPAGARLQLEGTAVVGFLGTPAGIGVGTRQALRTFARSLVETGSLEGDAQMSQPLPPAEHRRPGPPTHAIRDVAGKRTVVRLRFSC